MNKNEILMTKNLKRIFEKKGHKVHALSNVNLNIKQGDYISIQGPSGSGKTTLLNVLGCLDQASGGKIVIDGARVSDMSASELAKVRSDKIGFVFQDFNLIPILNAVENVELPMELMKISKGERRKKAEKLLKIVGLSERMDHRPGELSSGEQQRVAIARAFANDPAIILADEPTGNLDSKTSKKIMKLLNRLNDELNTTIIVVTHDDKMALMTKTLIYLKDGKVSKVKPLREGKSYEISSALDLSPRITNLLIRAGYNELDKVLNISDTNLKMIKKMKRKDVKQVQNRIIKYNRKHNT